jgi:hypothetical protein
VQVGRDNGTGTFNLNGGTVTTKKIEGGNGSATVNFNGGIVKAKQDESNFITNLDTANLQGGGAVINSDGYQLATSQVFTGTGGITKNGAGTLTLSSTSSVGPRAAMAWPREAKAALSAPGKPRATKSLTKVNCMASDSRPGFLTSLFSIQLAKLILLCASVT